MNIHVSLAFLLAFCDGGGASSILVKPDIISSGTCPVSLFIAEIGNKHQMVSSILYLWQDIPNTHHHHMQSNVCMLIFLHIRQFCSWFSRSCNSCIFMTSTSFPTSYTVTFNLFGIVQARIPIRITACEKDIFLTLYIGI